MTTGRRPADRTRARCPRHRPRQQFRARTNVPLWLNASLPMKRLLRARCPQPVQTRRLRYVPAAGRRRYARARRPCHSTRARCPRHGRTNLSGCVSARNRSQPTFKSPAGAAQTVRARAHVRAKTPAFQHRAPAVARFRMPRPQPCHKPHGPKPVRVRHLIRQRETGAGSASDRLALGGSCQLPVVSCQFASGTSRAQHRRATYTPNGPGAGTRPARTGGTPVSRAAGTATTRAGRMPTPLAGGGTPPAGADGTSALPVHGRDARVTCGRDGHNTCGQDAHITFGSLVV
jgi:hypothetical protein